MFMHRLFLIALVVLVCVVPAIGNGASAPEPLPQSSLREDPLDGSGRGVRPSGRARPLAATLAGIVHDAETGAGIGGAEVQAGGVRVVTLEDGTIPPTTLEL